MLRFCSLLLSGIVVLGITVSGLLPQPPVASETGQARAAAAAAGPAVVADHPVPSRGRGERTRKRDRRDRGEGAASGVQQELLGVSLPILPVVDGLVSGLVRVGLPIDFCGGLRVVLLATSDECTHGPDPAPAGFDVETPALLLADNDARAATGSIVCDGDGQSGYRVQVLYVRGSDVRSRYATVESSLRGWAGEANRLFRASAEQTGATRSLRFVHDARCQPIVEEVVLSTAGDGSFDRTISELKAKGYTRTDRIYLAFVDTTAAGICGVGTIWSDDRASGGVNWNSVGPSYSRVDAGCWGGWPAAHELMHNLGGVQHSAPNASGGFHCVDEYDIMCYRDGSGSRDIRVDCRSQSLDSTQLDCGHQDYFHAAPAPGSYLATRWNPANSRFLIGAPATAAPDDGGGSTSKGKKGKDKKGKGKKGKGGGKGRRR